MAIIKRNLWTLFFLIFFISSIGLFVLVYSLYNHDYDSFIKKQNNLTEITATSINSVFLQYEMLLDILGNQLLREKTYLNKEASHELLDNLLKINDNLASFSLINKNGEIYVTSSNLSKFKSLKNLLDEKETRGSFIYSLNSDKMVVGRTYYSKELQTLIIPLRKAIRDERGEVVAIMNGAIKVDKAFSLLSNTKSRTVLIRNFDNYIQLLNYASRKMLQEFYKVRIPYEHLQADIKMAEEKYNKNIEEIKKEEFVFSINYKSLMINKDVIASIKYLKRYEFWVISQIEKSVIDDLLMKKISILISIFCATMIVFFFLFRNLNEHEKKKQKALLYQAQHDHLTGLYNRLYLSKWLTENKNTKPYSLFFIDLDNFKNINDHYGHVFGDKVLIDVAKRLNSLKKVKDVVVRHSGDEFFLISETLEKDEVSKIAQAILLNISEPFIDETHRFIIGASIGIAQYPKDADNFLDIKRFADIAMYEAKKERNSFCFFENSIQHKYLRNIQIEQELKKALENDEIYMVYQPQVNKDGKLLGVEALVRWENKGLGFIAPDEFIKVAEDTGSMAKLGRYIMEKSIKEIKQIQLLTNVFFNLSINISVKQFFENDFYNKLLEYIEHSHFDKKYLTLEVTENVFIEDVDYILELLTKIKQNGIKISLDDFGTGYSSLSLLKKLPINELKIDKSFVDDILVDDASKSMIESIISIGKKFNKITVAEGIETKEQKELLDSFDCDIYQGYYYSKPLKKDALIAYLKEECKD